MRILRSLLLVLPLALIMAAAAPAASAASFQIVYNTPRGDDEADARAFIDEEGITRTVTHLVNDEFQLSGNLTLFLGGAGHPGFDSGSGEIHMPYGFVFTIADRFRNDSYSLTDVNIYDVTRDAYLHAILHEISHALFIMYDLRTSGDREKAIDALATLLLLRYYENGGDVVLHAAELFADERRASGGSQADFWAAHRLDRQSYNQAICLVYGSDPERYASLRDDSQFLQIRDQQCEREYQRQVDAWFRVLSPVLKRPPPD